MQANTANGNLTAVDTAITLPLAGYGAAAIQLTGTFSATVTFEASVDSINWRSILGTPTTSSTQASTATAVGLWFFNTTGLQEIRARCSAYTSGTIEIKTRAVLSSPASPPGAGGDGRRRHDMAGLHQSVRVSVSLDTYEQNVLRLASFGYLAVDMDAGPDACRTAEQ